MSPAEYEARVLQMAEALHEDCRLEWLAIAAVDPGRALTMHMADAHYGKAHGLVRRIFGEAEPPDPHNAPHGDPTGSGAPQRPDTPTDATPRLSAAPDGPHTPESVT